MPGVGKTYFGNYTAQKQGWIFKDLDSEITQKHKLSIGQIFEKWGEAEFRKLELEALNTLISDITETTIVATGGGTPCYNNNMKRMKDRGFVIWVDAPFEDIYQNIACDLTYRPLFETIIKDELMVKLSQMYELRKEIYSQSSLKVSVYRGYSPDLFTNTVHLSTFANGV